MSVSWGRQTTRNPTPPLSMPGWEWLRRAERQYLGKRIQEPPRGGMRCRLGPGGPEGSKVAIGSTSSPDGFVVGAAWLIAGCRNHNKEHRLRQRGRLIV